MWSQRTILLSTDKGFQSALHFRTQGEQPGLSLINTRLFLSVLHHPHTHRHRPRRCPSSIYVCVPSGTHTYIRIYTNIFSYLPILFHTELHRYVRLNKKINKSCCCCAWPTYNMPVTRNRSCSILVKNYIYLQIQENLLNYLETIFHVTFVL